jgi:hypothetical protein
LQFSISDYQTKKIIFEVGKDTPAPQDISVDFSNLGEDMYRKIKYTFSEDVMKLPLIQTTYEKLSFHPTPLPFCPFSSVLYFRLVLSR